MQKSDSVNRWVFTWRTILPNFVPILSQTAQPWAFFWRDRPNKKNKSSDMRSDMRSVPDLKIGWNMTMVKMLSLQGGEYIPSDASRWERWLQIWCWQRSASLTCVTHWEFCRNSFQVCYSCCSYCWRRSGNLTRLPYILLYLISKCLLAIGRNHVKWQSLNREFCWNSFQVCYSCSYCCWWRSSRLTWGRAVTSAACPSWFVIASNGGCACCYCCCILLAIKN